MSALWLLNSAVQHMATCSSCQAREGDLRRLLHGRQAGRLLMEHAKPWKADVVPVNHVAVVIKLLLKLVGGFSACYYLLHQRADLPLSTAESGPLRLAVTYNTGIIAILIILLFAYGVDDVVTLTRRGSPKKVSARLANAEAPVSKRTFDVNDLMGASMPTMSPTLTRSFHGLTSPTSFSPEPPTTSPAMMQSLATKLSQSLSRRNTKPGTGGGRSGAREGYMTEDAIDDRGTWTQSPFRDENLSPYGQYAPDAPMLAGDVIPKYHYSLAWTRADSMGVMKPVMAMRSQRWRSDREFDIDRSTLWTYSERARAWVAEHVLRGLVRRLATVTEAARKHRLGLPPLLPADRDWHALRPDASAVAGHLQYCASALDGIKRQLQQAQQAASAFQQQQQPQQLAQLQEQHKAARQHLQILRNYQGLCRVLQCTLPGVALGTPVTPAVLAQRAAALAESCCLSTSPDHEQAAISDSEVILYLVGAFLQAPFWRFDDLQQDSSSDAFQVVVSAEALTSRRMAFVLSSTAAANVANVEAGIEFCHRGLAGEHSWTQEQSASLIVRGVRCFERSGPWVCFELMALFFALVEQEFGSKIGANGLQYLKACEVVAPVKLPRPEPRWTWASFFR
eukprot:jgi/Ulvmu1/3609/UM017_0021.1